MKWVYLLRLLSSVGMAVTLTRLSQSEENWWRTIWRSLGGNLLMDRLMSSDHVRFAMFTWLPTFLLNHEWVKLRQCLEECHSRWDTIMPSQRNQIKLEIEGFLTNRGCCINICEILNFIARMPRTLRVVRADHQRIQEIFASFSPTVHDQLDKYVRYVETTSTIATTIDFSFKRFLFLSGAPGTGKTHTIRALASALNLPILQPEGGHRHDLNLKGQLFNAMYQHLAYSEAQTPDPLPLNFIWFIDDIDKIPELQLRDLLDFLDGPRIQMCDMQYVNHRHGGTLITLTPENLGLGSQVTWFDLSRVLIIMASNTPLEKLCRRWDVTGSAWSRLSGSEIVFPPMTPEAKEMILSFHLPGWCQELQLNLDVSQKDLLHSLCVNDPSPGVRQLLNQVRQQLCSWKSDSDDHEKLKN